MPWIEAARREYTRRSSRYAGDNFAYGCAEGGMLGPSCARLSHEKNPRSAENSIWTPASTGAVGSAIRRNQPTWLRAMCAKRLNLPPRGMVRGTTGFRPNFRLRLFRQKFKNLFTAQLLAKNVFRLHRYREAETRSLTYPDQFE